MTEPNQRGASFGTSAEVLEALLSRELSDRFCLVPFASLILEPDGKVGSCRHKGSEFPVGNIFKQSLGEIWNGAFIRQWRREFLAGAPVICKTEVRHRACHLCPQYNELLPRIQLSETQRDLPLRLGLNLNGKCNLRCRMCNIWSKPNGVYDSLGIWKKLEKIIPHLAEIELLSGEPFIQKDTYRIIDLVARTNPSCRFTITTNAHWRLSCTVKRALDRIQIKNLIVSLDSLDPDTYSLIRRGGCLDVVLKNLDDLIAYDSEREQAGLSRMDIRVNFLIQQDNWRELGAIQRFSTEKRLKVFRTFLYEPSEYSLLSLSTAEREYILDTYIAEFSADVLSNSMRILLPLLDSLSGISRARYFLRLRDCMGERPGRVPNALDG